MKLQFLDSLPKRLGISMGLSLLTISIAWLSGYPQFMQVYFFLLCGMALFLPISLFYAIVSTFFDDKTAEKNDDILDDINARR